MDSKGLCLNASRTLVYRTRKDRDTGRNPVARVLSAWITTRRATGRPELHVRALTPDGKLWHGQASGPDMEVNLFPIRNALTLSRLKRLHRL